MIRVRNYGFPGFFYEANPESSARNTATKHSTSNLVRPRYVLTWYRGPMRARGPASHTSSSSLRIWNARTMSVTPCISDQIPAKTSST
jgi:hypothetical protein